MVLAVLAGTGVAGTWAYWTDTATVTSDAIESGSMDLQFDASGATGVGTPYELTMLAATEVAPGESLAFDLAVRNVGRPTFAWSATVQRGATWSYLGSPLRLQVFAGTASTTTGYPRIGTCSGDPLGPVRAVTASAQEVLTGAPRALAGGGSDPLCLKVSMDPAAGNGEQGRTGTLRLDFTANQVLP